MSVPTARPRLAVVGGGWAGLSAAVTLREQLPQAQIVLFEAAPHLGGRARGLGWKSPRGLVPIDNGQHLVLGAHTQFLSLLNHCDAGHGLGGVHRFVWKCDGHALHFGQAKFPWGLLQGGLQTLAAHGLGRSGGWPMAWQWAMLRLVYNAQRCGWKAQGTVAEYLAAQSQPPTLIEALWRPMAESALNTGIAEAPARVFLELLKRTVAGPAGALEIWHPRHNLDESAVLPVQHWLQRREVEVRSRSRTDASALASQGFDGAVVAVSARHRHAFLGQTSMGQALLHQSHGVAEPSWRGIQTLFLLRHGANQDPGTVVIETELGGQPWPWVRLARPAGPWGQVEAWVLSALTNDLQAKHLRDALRFKALAELHNDGLGADHLFEHHDPIATWACTTQEHMGSAEDRAWRQHLPQRVGPLALAWAGDDGAPALPATIESAVISGRVSAQNLLASLG